MERKATHWKKPAKVFQRTYILFTTKVNTHVLYDFTVPLRKNGSTSPHTKKLHINVCNGFFVIVKNCYQPNTATGKWKTNCDIIKKIEYYSTIKSNKVLIVHSTTQINLKFPVLEERSQIEMKSYYIFYLYNIKKNTN